MKSKTIGIIFLILTFSLSGNAQKLLTRTGKITFFSSTPIENIESFNNEVSAIVDTESGEVLVIVPVTSFRFEKALMKKHFNEQYMESSRFPKATFKGKIPDQKSLAFSEDGTNPMRVSGTLTIHGVTQQVTIPGTFSKKGSEYTAKVKFKIKPADYDIQIPSLVTDKIAREIEVSAVCILKPQD